MCCLEDDAWDGMEGNPVEELLLDHSELEDILISGLASIIDPNLLEEIAPGEDYLEVILHNSQKNREVGKKLLDKILKMGKNSLPKKYITLFCSTVREYFERFWNEEAKEGGVRVKVFEPYYCGDWRLPWIAYKNDSTNVTDM